MSEGFGIVMTVLFGIGLLIGIFFAYPLYNVWQQGLAGEAAYERAVQDRKIKVLEAQAENEAAEFLNQAEITRARGVAEANKIIANGLGGPEGYLRYLWINQISKNGQNVIYIPTESGMPILEAGKRPEGQ